MFPLQFFSAMQLSTNNLRIGEGKRIKIEGKKIMPAVLPPSPPPPDNNQPPSNLGVNLISNLFISCPQAALMYLRQNLYLFLGLLCEQPDKANEYNPIVADFQQKIKMLETRIINTSYYNTART